jgi:hypothetical protein
MCSPGQVAADHPVSVYSVQDQALSADKSTHHKSRIRQRTKDSKQNQKLKC